MIIYAIETENEYNAVLVTEKLKSVISLGENCSKYPGNIAVEITNAYAELAQSNIVQAWTVFLLFSVDVVIVLI